MSPVGATLFEAAPRLGRGGACRQLLCACHLAHGTYIKATLGTKALHIMFWLLLKDPSHTCPSLANTHQLWQLPMAPVCPLSCQPLSCTLVGL